MLRRCDPVCNMARFYVLMIQPTLFGMGASRPTRPPEVNLFAGKVQAVEALEAWLVRKTRHGYVPQAPALSEAPARHYDRLEQSTVFRAAIRPKQHGLDHQPSLAPHSLLNRRSWEFLTSPTAALRITAAIPAETRGPQRAGALKSVALRRSTASGSSLWSRARRSYARSTGATRLAIS